MSTSNGERLIALLPMGYYWTTRLRSWRDVAYLIVTSWLPPLGIAWAEGSGSACFFATAFALGYLAFISVYEIGYLANDAWDARRDPDGRARTSIDIGPIWIAAFIAIRLTVWAIIGVSTGWLTQLFWVASYATLVVVFAIHNLVRQPSLRLATFSQLAVIRFIIPVLAVLTDKAVAPLILAALLAYIPLRLLAYADSKDLLVMPQRRAPWFGAGYLFLSLPLIGLFAWMLDSPSLAAAGVFLAVAHGAWSLGARQFKGAKR